MGDAVNVGVVPSMVTPEEASENTSPAGFLATIEMLYDVSLINPEMVIGEEEADASSSTLEPSKE